MTRCALVSSCGDPFLVLFLQKLFRERWYEEVDKMYININNHCGIPSDVISELLSKLSKDPKTEIIFHQRGKGNGKPITEMVQIADEDLILLLEDDGYPFEKGIVDECFQKIESDLCDAVGSQRGSCGPEIWDASKDRYKMDYSGYGDVGPNFWPNFFFCRRQSLLQTDLNFASKTFKKGEYSKELDYTFKDINHGDTFVWASMQLRAMGLRFHYVPQHKADPYELENKEKDMGNWHPSQKPFKWIHGGSLSAGIGGYLSGSLPATDESSIREMESRVAFWRLVRDSVDINKELIRDFDQLYFHGISNLIKNAHLDSGRINRKYNIYRELMKL